MKEIVETNKGGISPLKISLNSPQSMANNIKQNI